MSEIVITRRLVKSPPELWNEVSDAESLRRRHDAIGYIRITATDPETTVPWEGERASGTVEIGASGWGTSVTITARPAPALESPASERPSDPAPTAETPAPPGPTPGPPAPPAPDPVPPTPDPGTPEPGPPGPPEPAEPATLRLQQDVG